MNGLIGNENDYRLFDSRRQVENDVFCLLTGICRLLEKIAERVPPAGFGLIQILPKGARSPEGSLDVRRRS